jgi:diguanylate cyclase
MVSRPSDDGSGNVVPNEIDLETTLGDLDSLDGERLEAVSSAFSGALRSVDTLDRDSMCSLTITAPIRASDDTTVVISGETTEELSFEDRVALAINNLFEVRSLEGICDEIDQLRKDDEPWMQRAVGHVILDRLRQEGVYGRDLLFKDRISAYVTNWIDNGVDSFVKKERGSPRMQTVSEDPDVQTCPTREFLEEHMKFKDVYASNLLAQTIMNAFLEGEIATLKEKLKNAQLSEAEAKEAADYDGLTSLLSRKALDARISEIIKSDPDGVYTVMMIDLDDFSKVNNTYGHPVGDEVLIYAAETLMYRVRKPRLEAARYGGEEMAVLIKLESSAEGVDIRKKILDVMIRAQKLCSAFGKRTFVKDQLQSAGGEKQVEFGVTASIGVAFGFGKDLKAVFVRADGELYNAKSGGKNQVSCHPHLINPAFEVSTESEE